MPTPLATRPASASEPPSSAEQDVANFLHHGPRAGEGWAPGFLTKLFHRGSRGSQTRSEDTPPPRRILLVDDHPDTVEPLVRMLRRSGYEVECLPSAAAALSALNSKRPDVMLIDIMMPDMDGVQLLRAIRADARSANIPVVMLTADPRRCLDAFTSGAQDYLVKPVDWPRLRASVDRYLKNSRPPRA